MDKNISEMFKLKMSLPKFARDYLDIGKIQKNSYTTFTLGIIIGYTTYCVIIPVTSVGFPTCTKHHYKIHNTDISCGYWF